MSLAQGNALVLACSFGGAAGSGEAAARKAALTKGSPMRSCDSDRSSASVVSMSESSSDRCAQSPLTTAQVITARQPTAATLAAPQPLSRK